jgi:aminoglycoside phosphotransferase (APT) family kinase protein
MRLLRDYHDAASSFVPPELANWRSTPAPGEAQETICHNDVAPYNCVFRNGRPVALIDFDFACPGSRRWDLAHAAFRFVPLSQASDRPRSLTDAGVVRRLALVCDVYGLDDRSGFVELIEKRVLRTKAFAAEATAGNDENARRIRTEQHVERYERDVAFIRGARRSLERAIGVA